MFGRNESLIEMLPAPEDDEWPTTGPSTYFSKVNVGKQLSEFLFSFYFYVVINIFPLLYAFFRQILRHHHINWTSTII